MKRCSKCGIEKPLSEFSKKKHGKDGLGSQCKVCCNAYYIANRESRLAKNKAWRETNKESRLAKMKQWRSLNRDSELVKRKTFNYSHATGRTALYYLNQLTIEEFAKIENDTLHVKCSFCGKFFSPTVRAIVNRISALNGKDQGEARLYCSDACKSACPVFGKHPLAHLDLTKSKAKNLRPLQRELRELTLERDNYTCQICGSTEYLECHHIKPVACEPLESADVDNCITLCEDCHKNAHAIPGCSYGELAHV